MKRTRLKARPRDRGTDAEAARAWFYAVTHRKKCVECNKRKRGMQAHHVIAQQVIRTEFPRGAAWSDEAKRFVPLGKGDWPGWMNSEIRTLQDLLWDKRSGIPLCPDCHERHTNASRRVSVLRLPAAAFVFAGELGLQHRLGPRYYS